MKRRWSSQKRREETDELAAGEGLSGAEVLRDSVVKFAPISLFALQLDCHRKASAVTSVLDQRWLLPAASAFSVQEPFAKVYMAWDTDGLWGAVEVLGAIHPVSFPMVTEGSSVELFLDTRDSKQSGFIHRFCHHFVFLPQPTADGRAGGEITRFRTEDAHDWCAPEALQVETQRNPKGYTLRWMIPAHCLHGYDPEHFPRLGFTYRINRGKEEPQHFAVSAQDFSLEQQPSLWASMRLMP